jgi:putative spermidine/putrescine transport system permease protein
MLLALRLFIYLIVIIMLLPIMMSLPMALTAGSYVTFPPDGLSLKWFIRMSQDLILMETIGRSVVLALFAALLGVILSVPTAFAIERGRLAGRTAIETLITSPRMIPQIVLVLALLIFYEFIGLAETFTGLVIAHLLITVPLSFRTLHVGISSLDRRLEWSSAILGASTARTFHKIIVPHLKTFLIAAFTFAFIISFNNVTMALFLSAIGERTLPVEMFNRMYVGGMTPVLLAIAFVLAVVGAVTFIVLDRTIGVLKYLSGHN